MIDWTFHLIGTAVGLAGLFVTLIVMHNANVRRMAQLETKVDALWAWFESKLAQLNGKPK